MIERGRTFSECPLGADCGADTKDPYGRGPTICFRTFDCEAPKRTIPVPSIPEIALPFLSAQQLGIEDR